MTPLPPLHPQTEHPEVAESAVVGFPHDVKGEGVFAFIVLKENVQRPEEEIVAELRKMVRSTIAGYAVPDVILVGFVVCD